MLAGNWPPDGTTFSSESVSPWTLNVETESLPALTAKSSLCCAVVDERALRRDAIGLGARRRGAAETARRVAAGRRERAVLRAVVDDDPVAGQLVRLDEHGVVVRVRSACAPAAWPTKSAVKRCEQEREPLDDASWHASSMRFDDRERR